MDKSWIDKPRSSKIYTEGVANFIKFALEKESFDGKIYCPCRKCFNRHLFIPEVVEEHLVCNGFLLGYTKWIFHGETMSESTSERQHVQNMPSDIGFTAVQASITGQGGIRELLQDALGVTMATHRNFSENYAAESSSESSEGNQAAMAIDSPNEDSTRYHKLIQDSDQELYPGCRNYSKISFILHLFHLKCLNGWSGKSFTMLLELLKDAFPEGNSLPSSSYEAKKILTELDLGYEKIHSCPKDCMLYWGSRVNQESCHVCGSSRWVTSSKDVDDDLSKEEATLRKKKAAKVLRYFPLIPRLKRLYMSSKTASSMRWHDEGRNKDGVLRHPADGSAWKSFDIRYPDFASDPRSVRLGLASDGFNPFRTMSSTYSTWPVILIPYNLPPWLCMKRSSLILSMVIPGEKGPGNDIDIYLQPLVEELKQLWDGVEAFDASTKQNFNMRAALMWTINDFPAYANLSGWSTKGRAACPSCESSTDSYWLKNGRKFCYLGHRRWLEKNHPFRFQNHQFDGTTELRTAPTPPSGTDVLRQLEGIDYKYGKSSKLSRKRAKEDIGTSTVQELMEEVELLSEPKVLDNADGLYEVEDDDDDAPDASTHGVVQQPWKKKKHLL